ncbi:TonB-dependent receptor [Marivirga sp. S37H4]|uniref:TonB-dependent receptor n=1 Tax=Marivirga aurantiaca TaxID=2802615 RepID=A0A935CD58_9BACT|nr:TonB-dependent receptor [Marivirga aurantiaca]MBK6266593.1 TonB-dependent receptor [Marivirga aurantiaca]
MKNMYKSVFMIVGMVLALAIPSAFSNSGVDIIELKGVVRDAESKEPIVGVNIYLPDIEQGTTSNVNGEFSIKVGNKNKKVLIQISYVGYKTKLIRVNTAEWKNGETIFLEEESIVVNEVIVSAGRIASRDEIPVLVEKMGIKEMRTDGEINTMTSLMRIPGVEQIAYGTGVGKPVIRGMSFSRILSMYQGARFENQQWGADHGLGVNDLGIEAVEVIKGPASFLYGSGAVGGVVYLVDERAAPKGRMLAEINSTFHSNTLGMRQTIGLKETRQSGLFYGINAALENHADYIDGNGRTIGNSRFNTQTFRANTGLQKDWGTIKLSYTYHQQNLGIIADDELSHSLATTRNDRNMQLPFQNIQDHLLTFNSILQLGTGRLETTVGHHFNSRKEIEAAYDLVDLGLLQTNTTFDTKYFLENNNSEHIVGVQGFHLTNSNMANVEEILIPDAQLWDASLYYLYTLRKDKTTWQAGLRYDGRSTTADASSSVIREFGYNLPQLPNDQRKFTTQHNGISGSVGLIHQFNQQLNLKSNFSSGFRAPDLAELFSNGQHAGTQRYEVGNVNFDREQNFQLDLAMQYQNRFFSFEVSPFINLISNYIYLTPTGEPKEDTDLMIWAFDQGNAYLYGGELQSKIRPMGNEKLEFNFAYSVVRGENPETGNKMPLIPADRIVSSLKCKLPSVLEGSYFKLSHNYVFEQNRLSPREKQAYTTNSTDAFQIFGASVGGSFKIGPQAVNLDVAVNNIFNKAYVDHLSFLRAFDINNIGRNLTVNLNLPLKIK